jgi:hypothetical protein
MPTSASKVSESRSESKPESKSPPPRKEREKGGALPNDLPVGPVAHLVAVAAQTATTAASAPQREAVLPKDGPPELPAVVKATRVQVPIAVAEPGTVVQPEIREATLVTTTEPTEALSPDFVLSAGVEPPQSWIRANIFVIVVVLLVAAGVALTVLLH